MGRIPEILPMDFYRSGPRGVSMDEKTEQLRDIFMEVAEEATVTEHQEETRGSLADERPIRAQLQSVIESMADRYEFRTSLTIDDLVTVVERFYAGDNDTEIARELGDESLSKTVSRARIDLHLVTDRDTDAPFDLDRLRDLLDTEQPMTEIADELGVSESTVRRYRHIVDAQTERRVIGDRFREEFELILEDRGLSNRLTADIQQTGLEEATEGMETNVSF